ncbi:MBOAT family O-acyltransferase, partial [Helicobacter canis]
MLFNSYLFIFCFLPIVWAVFHILKALSVKKDSTTYMTLAKGFLVIASLFFYAYWKFIYLPILLGSIVVNYCLAKGIVRSLYAKKQINMNFNGGGGKLEGVSFLAKNGDYCSESAVTHAQVRALDSPCKTPFLAQKSFREQVALESTQAIESKQITGDSKIVDEKTRQSRSFFSKCGLQAKAQGSYLSGNDRRAFVQLPHLSSKAESLQTQKLSPKTLLTLGIIFNLFLLGIFKYTDFFLENFNLFSKLLALDFTIPLPHILLPLALSFVTFQQIAFLVDCYKQGKEREETKKLESNIENNAESKKPTLKTNNEIPHINFLDYCLFITFFPQLIAGPIVHHREMMPQFYAMTHPIGTNNTKPIETKTLQITIMDNKPSIINWEYIAKGLFIFSIGLFKKVVIADSFAKWANAGFSAVENGAILNCLES